MNQLVQNTTEVTTVPQVFALVGDDVVARWERLGEIDSKTHWAYGMEAEQLIAEGIGNMLVYKAIAIKTGKSAETIRQAYYTYKAFTDAERKQFEAAPYSVFRHAKDCEDKIAVLEHYINNQSSVDEIETIYPTAPDDEIEKDFRALDMPRMFYGIYREIWGASVATRNKVIAYLRVIKRVIDEVNNGHAGNKKPF
ncbi:MAG: hypothetical protein E6Q97_00285 [Desulfurellales bacterium]|nr:MAG: hypothetical protein E6Q97_00285 [Desulfurellales bacterium]